MVACCTNSIKMWDLSDQRNLALRVLGGLPATLATRLGTDPSAHHSDETRRLLADNLAKPLSRYTASNVVAKLTNQDLLNMVRSRVEATRKPAGGPAGGSSRRIKTKLKKKLKTKPKYTIKYKKYSKRRPIKNKN